MVELTIIVAKMFEKFLMDKMLNLWGVIHILVELLNLGVEADLLGG